MTAAVLESIVVTPAEETVAKGIAVQYKAMGYYSDSSSQDLTLVATWQSSNTAIATIDASGLANTIGIGTTTITANFDGKTGTATLNVTAATITSIQVTPADVSVPKGTTGTYTAIAYFTDSTSEDITLQATWQSADINIVSIVTSGDTAGYAEALNIGNTTITAVYDGVTSNIANVEVTAAVLESIVVTPADLTVTVLSTIGYLAEGHYSDSTIVDITLDVTWASSNTSTATIEATGDLIGVTTAWEEGVTTISATLDGITGNTNLTVEGDCGTTHPESIYITPDTADVKVGYTTQFLLIGVWPDSCEREVTFDPQSVWSINQNESHIAEMKSKGGLVLGKKANESATVNAKYTAANINDTATVNVIP